MPPIPSTMKAVLMDDNGGLEVLQHRDVPVPKLGQGQVLVRNKFSGVNFIDTYFRTGLYKSPGFPFIFGREASGDIIAAHPSVASKFPDLKPGARVVFMGGNEAPSYAEFSAISAEKVVVIPEGVTYETAAAVYLQGLTAWTLIREAAGGVKPGQWTLVHAAAGGVGALLVQMLNAVGAKVIAVAGTEEKLANAKANGAGWTILSSDDVVAKVKEITGGHGIDAIFDGVGKATFEADMEMIAVKGHLVSFGNASGAVDPVSLLRLGAKNIKLVRPTVNVYVAERADLEKYSSELFEFVTSGKLKASIHEIYPLKDAARAQGDIESRKTSGKLLLAL